MAKNVVLCFDGTGNDFSGRPTNVVKLYRSLDVSDPGAQVAFYDPGVGTAGEGGARNPVAGGWRKLTGLAFGRGILKNILDGYQFLMSSWEHGDRIFLFGFSRGAYTARALAGMLHKLGLLHTGSNLGPYALRLFRTFPQRKKKRRAHWDEVERFRELYTRECDIHFVGVWDTVNSVGAWGTIKSLRPMRALGFKGGSRLNFTANNPSIVNGRHAVAIDEKRTHFRTNLWNKEHSDTHQEVWFPGVHSDVGGGYAESGLSDVTLEWMTREGGRFGLLVKPDARRFVAPDPLDKLHNSLVPAWWPLGWKKRRIRAFRSDWPARVHSSVAVRRNGTHGHYSPEVPQSALEVD